MSTRIYLVTNRNDDSQHLVRASSPAAAIRHVARSTFGAAVAAQESLVELLTAGIVVEDARADEAETPQTLAAMPAPREELAPTPAPPREEELGPIHWPNKEPISNERPNYNLKRLRA